MDNFTQEHPARAQNERQYAHDFSKTHNGQASAIHEAFETGGGHFVATHAENACLGESLPKCGDNARPMHIATDFPRRYEDRWLDAALLL
jgi:hypothetical protein